MALSKELADIADRWDKKTGDGRDEGVRDTCKEYVAAHPELFVHLKDFSIEQIVNAVSVFRAAHRGYAEDTSHANTLAKLLFNITDLQEAQWLVEVWSLGMIPPQQIGGEYRAQLRYPGVV